MLDRISEKLMHRSAEIENQIGLKLDILPAERNVVEVGPEQSIQQVHDRTGLPPPSVTSRCASASASTRARYFSDSSATLRDVRAVCENNASSCENRLPDRWRISRIIS